MVDDELFGPGTTPDGVDPETALLEAHVRVEVELLGALIETGVVRLAPAPPDDGAPDPGILPDDGAQPGHDTLPDDGARLSGDAARARGRLEAALRAARIPDVLSLAARARAGGNVVIPLVKDILAAAPDDLAPAVHLGATSQDIVDTAQQLVLAKALESVAADLRAARDRAAGLAREHAQTPRVGRTLGQVAVPTTFGLTAATWAVGLHRAALSCDRARDDLAIQLAGAAGTAAVHGERWPEVAEALSNRLDLRVPEAPWHTERSRIRAAATALADAVAAAAKIGTDVATLAVTEIGELAEGGAGGSSAMPHKRNPVRSVLLRAAGIRAPGLLGTVYSASLQENERAAGGWHAEWQPVADLVRLGRGSAGRVRDLLDTLHVDADAMRRNLDAARPFTMSEAVATALAGRLGRAEAQAAVSRALRAGGEAPTDGSVRAALRADVGECPELDDPELLEPGSALTAVPALIDRALSSCKETA